jgi:hypothetical protein
MAFVQRLSDRTEQALSRGGTDLATPARVSGSPLKQLLGLGQLAADNSFQHRDIEPEMDCSSPTPSFENRETRG